jgi:hypothetical protein
VLLVAVSCVRGLGKHGSLGRGHFLVLEGLLEDVNVGIVL